jgi:hypothetical protein
VYTTYFALARGPGGRRYPFLAPGWHYVRPSDPPHWDFLCFFDPAAIASPDPACATGFRRYQATFAGYQTESGFRHNGGWLDDVDGDGWDDLHLPYLKYILSVSGRTGAQIALSSFDVAAQSEPGSPPFFHSGRFYGSFTSYTSAAGERRVLFSAGTTVGSFTDHYCNVSRYMAVASWGYALDLAWSNYYSFIKTIFREPYAIENYSRYGDAIDRCVHRTSDSLYWAGSEPVTLFSYFDADPLANDCQAQVLGEQQSGFEASALAAYTACAEAQFLPALGRWTIQALRLSDGGGVNAWPGAYLWGRVTDFAPGEPYALLIETFSGDGKVRYDRVGHVPEQLYLSKINADYTWTHFGAVSAGAQPSIALRANHGLGSHPPGLGHSYAGIPELITADVDGDGFQDVQLTDGSWIGYGGSAGSVVRK